LSRQASVSQRPDQPEQPSIPPLQEAPGAPTRKRSRTSVEIAEIAGQARDAAAAAGIIRDSTATTLDARQQNHASKRPQHQHPRQHRQPQQQQQQQQQQAAQQQVIRQLTQEEAEQDIREEWKVLCSHILYADIYSDNVYEYRHVTLPKRLLEMIPMSFWRDGRKGLWKLMEESEWRFIGIHMSTGWEHYMCHDPEPHVLLFRRTIQLGDRIRREARRNLQRTQYLDLKELKERGDSISDRQDQWFQSYQRQLDDIKQAEKARYLQLLDAKDKRGQQLSQEEEQFCRRFIQQQQKERRQQKEKDLKQQFFALKFAKEKGELLTMEEDAFLKDYLQKAQLRKGRYMALKDASIRATKLNGDSGAQMTPEDAEFFEEYEQQLEQDQRRKEDRDRKAQYAMLRDAKKKGRKLTDDEVAFVNNFIRDYKDAHHQREDRLAEILKGQELEAQDQKQPQEQQCQEQEQPQEQQYQEQQQQV
ncbi:hypothetical protein BGZ99_002881, partial [Dissophora globulifera]